jgi:hypothetical protein
MRSRLIRRLELLEDTVKPKVTEMPPEALSILKKLGRSPRPTERQGHGKERIF